MSLRSGITTGTCAAAAAKAAATRAGRRRRAGARSSLRCPAGKTIRLPIVFVRSQRPPAAAAAVRKDAGDDPDVTHGLEVRVAALLERRAGRRPSRPAKASARSPSRGCRSRRASRPSIPCRGK